MKRIISFIFIYFGLLIPYGFSAGFHQPYEIWNGTFGNGKYIFPDDLQVDGELCVGGVCRNSWPAGSTADITGVAAGTGLTGGGDSGDVTLNVDTSYFDSRFVNVAGDTMTNQLTISTSGDSILLNGNPPSVHTIRIDNAPLRIWSGDGVGEIIRFNNNTGFVGVGTSTPNVRLDVSGSIEMNDELVATRNWVTGQGFGSAGDYVLKTGDTMSGDLRIADTSPVLIIQDTDSTGNAHVGWISLKDNSDTEKGWLGFGTGANDDLYVQNNYAGGHLKLNTNGGGVITTNTDLIVGDNLNKRIFVRHIDGKDTTTNNVDHLYLQHSNGLNVYINGQVAYHAGNHPYDTEAEVDAAVANNGYLSTTGKAADSNLLDGIDSAAFVRSDVNDDVNGQLFFRDDLIFDSNTNTEKLFISRLGGTSNEFLSMSTDDTRTVLHRKNDENMAVIRFDLEATDTESGGGAAANSGYVDFVSDPSGVNINLNGNNVATQAWVTAQGYGSGNGDITQIRTGYTHAGCDNGVCDLRNIDGTDSGLDADRFDNFDSSQFLRSDTSDSIAAGDVADPLTISRTGATANQVGIRYTTSMGSDKYMGVTSDEIYISDTANLGAGNKVYHTGNHPYDTEAEIDAAVANNGYTSQATNDGRYVNTAGDTMTGNLVISRGAPIITLDESDNSNDWWIVADGNTYSVRLNNTGSYPISVGSDRVLKTNNNVVYHAANHPYDTEAEVDAAVANNGYSTGAHTVDTNAGTLCASGQYLDGDGVCRSRFGIDSAKTGTADNGWANDLSAAPRDFHNFGLSTGMIGAAEQGAPINYAVMLNVPSYTSGQDGGAGQILFPYDLGYTGNGNPMFRTGDYNNAGWSAWKTFMDKAWADTLYQDDITGSCPAGQAIRQINNDGTVICEVDDNSGGDIQGVTAGNGLTGGGSSGTPTLNVGAGTGIIVGADNVGIATDVLNDLTVRAPAVTGLGSGFFETSTATTAEGWPENDGSWYHLINSQHSNGGNNYALQIAGDFHDQDLFWRSTNNNGATAWNKFASEAWVSGNYMSSSTDNWVNTGGDSMTGALTINAPGTIGGANIANGWLKIGSNLAMDNNEIYFGGIDGIIGTIGNYDLTFTVGGGDINLGDSRLLNINWAGSDDGANSGLDADLLDGMQASAFMKSTNANGYDGLNGPNAGTSNWIRTTTNGIIPYQSGGASALGTSSWPFNNIYANNIYDNGVEIGSKFLAISGKAADSNLLDGIDSTGFIRDNSPGNWEVASNSNSAAYGSAALEIRELNIGGAQTGAVSEAPRLAFHWGGRVASQISINPTNADIEIRNNPGTGYEDLRAANIYSSDNLVATQNWVSGNYLGTSGKAADSNLLDGIDSTGFARTTGFRDLGTVTFNQATGSTTDFIAKLDSWGAFSSTYSVMKASWSYAGNQDITDAGFGSIELAGAVVETFRDGSYKTVRVTRPNTGSAAGRIFVYNDQGSGYSPGWREVLTSYSSLNGDSIVDGTVDSSEIQDNTLTAADLAPDSVAGSELTAPFETGSAYDGRFINVGESGDSIADGTIDSSEIQDNTLTAADLAPDSVTASEIAANAVGNSEMIDNPTFSRIITAGANDYCKYGVWNSGSTYCIGMVSAQSYGGLNDYAMTFTMNNDADRGFLWRDDGDTASDGAMSLTTGGVLTVKSSVTATAFYYSSDERLKKNIKYIDSESSLDKIKKLNAVSYEWINPEVDKGTEIGLIAQDVEEVFPELVEVDGNGYKSVQYGNLVAPLIEAIKEQQAQIDELRTEIKNLKGE